MTSAPRPLTIRDATEADLPAIFAIYNPHALRGVATFDTQARSVETHGDFLRSRNTQRHPVLVACDDAGEVLGYASLSSWSDRCAYARAAELSVYVREDAQGKGVGAALMRDVIDRGRRAGLGVLLSRIAVAEETRPSLRLHEKFGFQRIGVMRRVGEKFGRVLDVDLLDLHLDAAAEA